MKTIAGMRERGDGRGLSTAVKVLLLCGILSSILYVGSDIAASMRYAGYSYVDQAFSELLALGSPVRSFMLPLSFVYNLLVLACAAGVWMAAGSKRSLRITAIMLAVYGIASLAGPYVPMHVRGAEGTLTDLLHVVDTAAMVLSIIAAMGFGAAALGKRFRVYSIGTIAALVTFGAWSGTLAPRMAAGEHTPWLGIIERMNIYPLMLWIAVLAIALLQAGSRYAAGASRAEATPGATRKVTVLVGSPHKGGATYTAARRLVENLESFGDVRGEIVMLGDYELGVCRGCKLCFARGEETCPLRDDRDVLVEKMDSSDGVVFASPNYSWNVSGLMKVFLDRLGFAFHRPRFHGKAASSIVVMGIFRGNKIRDYLEFVAGGLGFNVVKGSVIRTLEPMSDAALKKMNDALDAQAIRLHDQLLRPAFPTPSVLQLMMFRMSRTGFRTKAAKGDRDYTYFRDQGWFESDYYYPTHLNPLKRAAGALFDWVAEHTSAFDVADER